MLPILKINGQDLTGLIAIDGLKQSTLLRQAKTVVTLDGTEYRGNIPKRQLDVQLVEMRADRLTEIVSKITQPSSVTYVDRHLGQVTKDFWVDGLASADKIVQAGLSYIDGVSFSLVER